MNICYLMSSLLFRDILPLRKLSDRTILRNIDGNLKFIKKVTDVTSLEENSSDRIIDRMKTQSILLPGNDKQKLVTDGYPNLRKDCNHGCSVEGFDVQMLLDPLEKDFKIPFRDYSQNSGSECSNFFW